MDSVLPVPLADGNASNVCSHIQAGNEKLLVLHRHSSFPRTGIGGRASVSLAVEDEMNQHRGRSVSTVPGSVVATLAVAVAAAVVATLVGRL